MYEGARTRAKTNVPTWAVKNSQVVAEMMDERSYKAGQNKEWYNYRDSEGGRNIKESAGKYFEVVWACIGKRRRMWGQESDGDRGAVGEKERKSEAQVVG